MASKVAFTKDRGALAGEQVGERGKCPGRLRSVVSELERVASLLEGTTSDAIGFFDETKNR